MKSFGQSATHRDFPMHSGAAASEVPTRDSRAAINRLGSGRARRVRKACLPSARPRVRHWWWDCAPRLPSATTPPTEQVAPAPIAGILAHFVARLVRALPRAVYLGARAG